MGGMSWLWFSCLALLLLLPPVSFAEAHLWKYKPFRANDTDHSGGDHICDLRRDSNADGKPDRLGDYVTVSGTVIVEPSTFETGGSAFWIRGGACGILVYGKQTEAHLGDSVMVTGWVGIPDGDRPFPGTGLTGLRDAGLRGCRVMRVDARGNPEPARLSPHDYASCPRAWDGNLVDLTDAVRVERVAASGGNTVALATRGQDTITVYIDADTDCRVDARGCYHLTGVVANLMVRAHGCNAARWCLIPRGAIDIAPVSCSTDLEQTSWGRLKAGYVETRGE